MLKYNVYGLLRAPLLSRSGYGEHARDIFYSLYDLDRFDIKIQDQSL